MKSYLRYEPKKVFGVIASPQCNVVYDCSGNLAITGTLQEISLWNLRQASCIGGMKVAEPNYPYSLSGDVTLLLCGTDKSSVAAGYSGGEVRIFNYINRECVATLRGHRSAVTSLAYEVHEKGVNSLLASGGADSDIFLWDLVTLTGVCKLRGHKDAVTGLAFIERAGQKLVVSVSKDTLLKVWDVATQHCVQTIVGHRCEIWSLAVYRQGTGSGSVGEEDGEYEGVRVVTGGADELLRGYRLAVSGTKAGSAQSGAAVSTGKKGGASGVGGEDEKRVFLGDEETLLVYFGCVRRDGSASTDACRGLHVSPAGTLLAAQSAGKVVEFFRLKSPADAKKKVKRRLKRMREKGEKDKEREGKGSHVVKGKDGGYSAWDEAPSSSSAATGTGGDAGAGDETDPSPTHAPHELVLSDELEAHCLIRALQKVRGCAFHPAGATGATGAVGDRGKGKEGGDRVLLSLASNLLEVWKVAAGGAGAVVATVDGKERRKSKKDKEGKKRSGSVGSADGEGDDEDNGNGNGEDAEGEEEALALSAVAAGPVTVSEWLGAQWVDWCFV